MASQRRIAKQAFWQGMAFRRRAGRAVATTIIALGGCVLMIPILWMLRTSLMHPGKIFIQPIVWFPNPIRFQNYAESITEIPFWIYARNSVAISILTVFGSVISASLVGFAFARLRAPDRDILFVIVLGTMMLPGEVLMIPQYLLFRKLGWIDSFLPLVVPAYFGGGPFFIFLFRQFFMSLPRELDDAAKIDGAGFFRIYWDLILPLSKPALATVSILSFFWSWNDFLGPLIYLDDTEKWTLPIGLRVFSGVQIYTQTRWHLMMAASLLTLIPPVLLFFSSQRIFVQGMVLTGIKG
jgi:ABC-type glycerol-3-phosphate transport system permease component